MAPPLSDSDTYRWTVFVRELDLATAGGTLPVDLTTLPIALVSVGEGARLVAVQVPLLAALRTYADLLAPASIGPRHHALAATLMAIESAGIALGPVLTAVRTQWTAPPKRAPRPHSLDGLVPFVPPKRR
jgi:hypothetical protein